MAAIARVAAPPAWLRHTTVVIDRGEVVDAHVTLCSCVWSVIKKRTPASRDLKGSGGTPGRRSATATRRKDT